MVDQKLLVLAGIMIGMREGFFAPPELKSRSGVCDATASEKSLPEAMADIFVLFALFEPKVPEPCGRSSVTQGIHTYNLQYL